MGVVISVAGSAVGLGNFLRFPGLAAQSNGRAFMIAYAISFLIIGLPIGWTEWAMGRYAGIIGVIIPVVIYTYYVILEPWCIGYAANFWTGQMHPQDAKQTVDLFVNFTGAGADAKWVCPTFFLSIFAL